MRFAGLILGALLLTGCGATEPVKSDAPKAEAPKVPDHTRALMRESQTSSEVVQNHILGMKTLPGGSLGHYQSKKSTWQLFIVDTASNQDAALLLFDVKKTELQDKAGYLAHMGGYFGQYDSQPVYIFAKTHYVAGVVGLSQKDADPIARTLASRIF